MRQEVPFQARKEVEKTQTERSMKLALMVTALTLKAVVTEVLIVWREDLCILLSGSWMNCRRCHLQRDAASCLEEESSRSSTPTPKGTPRRSRCPHTLPPDRTVGQRTKTSREDEKEQHYDLQTEMHAYLWPTCTPIHTYAGGTIPLVIALSFFVNS